MAAQQQGEPAFFLVIGLALIFGLCWLFWHFTHNFWIEYFFRWLRYSELWSINLFTHKYDACLEFLRIAQVDDPNPSAQVIRASNQCFGRAYLSQFPREEVFSYYQLSYPVVRAFGAEAETYFRWPLFALLCWVGFYGIFFSPIYKFMTKHTLESLIAIQAKMWPVISPIVKFNPSKSGRILGDKLPEKLPIFAEALSPEEWISWHRIPLTNNIPERDSVRRAFIQQLGPRWTGMGALPVHMRALLAAFVLKGLQKREDSDKLLGRLAEFWSPGSGFRPDGGMISEINDVLNDPDRGGKIAPVLDKHAWRTTAMLGALQWARNNGGVLAPAQFLWLRAEDRALWYPLNNLGRRAYHSEGAGAMAHYMAEVAAKKPLPIPRVDTAVVTLNTYLHDPDKRSVPIPPREEVG